MEALPLPKTIKFIKEDKHKSVFVIEPCYPGYGVTVGNALRRVLLSSLPGAAVTSLKIKGTDHEFSSIPGVKEDVIDIILNVKKLYVKSYSEDPVNLVLKIKGAKEVKASMFEKNSQVEIANPDLHICTLDGKNSEFEMEIVVKQGRGISTVEMREDEKQEIGMIAIDAFFTPVRNVNLHVENMRVGKITDYDRLTMTVITNGTINGKDAVEQSAKILVDHFQVLIQESQIADDSKKARKEEGVSEPKTQTIDEQPTMEAKTTPEEDDLLSLSLSRRAYNGLQKNGVKSINDLKKLDEAILNGFSGLGEKSIKEILEVIKGLN